MSRFQNGGASRGPQTVIMRNGCPFGKKTKRTMAERFNGLKRRS